ncbi:MAG: hypothetical protein AAGD06_14025 [Acidobacteriota bacterium]
MRNQIRFRLTNQLTESTGQIVLVFLVPAIDRHSDNAVLTPWQVLNPAPNGGNQPFLFDVQDLQLAVENQDTLCQSRSVDVHANQLYTVTNNHNQGPVLHLSRSEVPRKASQISVRNTTDPPATLRSIWKVGGRPVLVKEGINLGSTNTVEIIPTLFFIVVQPLGDGSPLRQYSREFPYQPMPQMFKESRAASYDVPVGQREVSVRWIRPGGMSGADVLVFDPPSARPQTFL